MALTITVNGIAAAQSAVRTLAPEAAGYVVRQMSRIAYDAVQKGAGAHSKKGDLFASVYNRSGGPLRREVGHDPARAPHAVFVVFGTRPHVIKPKNKKALRWAAGGKFAFAKQVNHPGYRGDNYMQRAADEAIRQFDTLVTQAMKEAT